MAETLLKPAAVAEMLIVTVGTLANWRYQGVGPKSTRAGRAVRYRLRDVEAYLKARDAKVAA